MHFAEPWILWEVFGGIFYALRINALLLTEMNNHVPFEKIIAGASIFGCNSEVILRPTLFRRSAIAFSEDLALEIELKTCQTTRVSWKGDDNHGYIWLNGISGEGVDIFFALPQKDSPDKYVICVDQQKREATSYGPVKIAHLLQKAQIRPLNCENDILICGLCNMLPFDSKLPLNNKKLPKNYFLVLAMSLLRMLFNYNKNTCGLMKIDNIKFGRMDFY